MRKDTPAGLAIAEPRKNRESRAEPSLARRMARPGQSAYVS
jgi:hypothetical protein